MSDDPFQILADEITAIRKEVENLQRTSLDKDEAKALHQIVATSVTDLQKAAPALEALVDQRLRGAIADIEEKATVATEVAARYAVLKAHEDNSKTAKELLESAGDVHRQAWKYFGSFWAWMVAGGAVMLSVGVLATMMVEGKSRSTALKIYGELECMAEGGRRIDYTDGTAECGYRMKP